MPTAVLQTNVKKRDGHIKITEQTKVITHNNARLYHEAGRTYMHVGLDRNGNRIYRDTQKR
jgi:hypothetical protein